MRKGQGFTWKAPHHAYWGLIIFLINFAWLFHCPRWLLWLPTTGAAWGFWVTADDFFQHLWQAYTGRYPGMPDAYHSFWHNQWWSFLNHLLTKAPEGSLLRQILEWMRSV